MPLFPLDPCFAPSVSKCRKNKDSEYNPDEEISLCYLHSNKCKEFKCLERLGILIYLSNVTCTNKIQNVSSRTILGAA